MIGRRRGQIREHNVDETGGVVGSRGRAPVTTTVRNIPTEVPLDEGAGVVDGSVANLDNVQLLPVDRLLRRAGAVPSDRWPAFCRAMASAMAC